MEKLGAEWFEKGLLNIPSYLKKESNGVAIGHTLWCYNLLMAYGMYDFAKVRYSNMETTKSSWKSKKSFEENVKKMSVGNPGCSYDDSYDYTEAFKQHYNPELAKKLLAKTDEVFKKYATFSEDDRQRYEAEVAYDLTTWTDFCGNMDELGIGSVLLQVMSGNRFGPLAKTGPDELFKKHASTIRSYYEE